MSADVNLALWWQVTLAGALALACVITVAACVCRVNILRPREHKYGWVLMYIAMAGVAGGVAIDLLQDQTWPNLALCCALWAIWLNLGMTHHQWRNNNAPPIAQKDPPGWDITHPPERDPTDDSDDAWNPGRSVRPTST